MITIKSSKVQAGWVRLLQCLAICVALIACQKKQPPTSSASEPGAAPAEAAAETPTAAPEAPAASAASAPSAPAPAPAAPSVNGVVVPFLTTQLRVFIQEKGRLPESFAEFAGARLDSVPRLGPGLTFAIDPTTQEVKIVHK